MLGDPALYATALLERLGIAGPPDVFHITRALSVDVEERDVASFDGALVRVRGAALGIIAVRASIRENTRKRFTVAHELGHLLLPGHEHSTVCSADRIENWARDVPAPELEANRFAGELLVPSTIALKKVGIPKPSLKAVDDIAHAFRTSLTASAYRFCELTPYAVAVVWSAGGVVRWFKRSDEFRHWIRIRERVDEGTLAHDLFQRSDVSPGAVAVAAGTWLEGTFDKDDTILEESRAIPSYDGVLTLLWLPAPLTDERRDDELLPELDPADFTLGRRRWPGKR